MGKYGKDIASSSSVNGQKNHHFFQVFTPDKSSHHLKLPAAFINKLDEDLPKKGTLRDSTDKLWSVKVVKSGNDYFFQNGWEDFVNHYTLQYGNFLMFNYHGNSRFHVSVFDYTTQCEREDTTIDYVIGNGNPSLGEDACELEVPESLRKSLGDSSENSSENYEVIANSYDDPEKPRFTTTVNERSPYAVHIPKQLVIDHALELKTDMTIRVQSGKKWPVEVYFEESAKRYIICRGWHDFKTDNNMKHGEKCILEFKKGRGGRRTSDVIHAYPLNVKLER
ncbi:putative B3 domain-containing protein At5g66980 [Papaver somniferum]|nr:putative B3 domain-containing protein At5g66980 [Papaver somniferum]